MGDNIEIVKNLYTTDGIALEDMRAYTTKKLKAWEKQVISTFPAQCKVLDIGCGMGREAFCLHDMGFQVTGVDLSEQVIKTATQIAAANGVDVEFVVNNGLDLPFGDSCFDVVVIWAQTFGLFYGEENQQRILRECRRVLKNGGILSFSGHDAEYLQETLPEYLVGNRFYAYADTDCYWTAFSVDELTGAATQAGFSVISCQRGLVYTKQDGTILHCECRK